MIINQEGLIDLIIEYMGLNVYHRNPKSTLFTKAPITKELYGNPFSESFAYTIIVVMLLCLTGNSRPDLLTV